MGTHILGSHNSWSYLKPRKWWMRLIAFAARCQSSTIKEQYRLHGVRCFDLRLRWDKKGNMIVAHGIVEYEYTEEMLLNDLKWLNEKGDCYVRIIHEARNKRQYIRISWVNFWDFCELVVQNFPNIHWWCGRNLYNWQYDYQFGPQKKEPTCTEKYSSVCPPKYLDDWWPWLYAKINNEKILQQGTSNDILLIDFVEIKEL